MESLRTPDITLETIWRTVLITDARNSSRAYLSGRADEGLLRIEQDRALFGRIAADHGGEEVRDRGDGSMFAFCDPAAAVRAAMAMQLDVARHNAALPEGSLRLVHRMGVHMGPLKLATTPRSGGSAARQKMSGDIVMLAARMEAVGHPGEVCLSDEVHKAIRGQIDHDFGSFEATLKGFDRPVRCWSTRLDRTLASPLTPEEEAAWTRQREERRLRERWARERRVERRQWGLLVTAGLVASLTATFAGVKVLETRRNEAARGSEVAFSSSEFSFDEAGGASRDGRASGHRSLSSPSSGASSAKPPGGGASASGEGDATNRRSGASSVARGRSSKASGSSASDTQMGAAMREAMANGRLKGERGRPGTRLSGGRAVPAEPAPAAPTDDAARFQRARDWLAERLAAAATSEKGGLILDNDVAGFAMLTEAGPTGIRGVDASGALREVAYADLNPDDFVRLLRAAETEEDPLPEDPVTAARSLAALRGGGGR